MYFDNQLLLVRLWNITQRAGSIMNSYSTQNEVKHFITDRFRKKTLATFNLRKESCISLQHSGGNGLFNIRKILYFILNREKHNHNFPVLRNVLKFQLQETLLENFFLKHGKKLLSIAKKAISKEDLEKQWGGPEAYKLILFIKDDFYEVIKNHPSVVVFFSADWCHHCLKLRGQYGSAALMAKEANLSTTFATFDVATNPDIADENGVIGIPTVKYYNNGKITSTFRGKRTADDLFAYVKNPPSLTESKKADV